MTTRRPDVEANGPNQPTMVVGLDGSTGSQVALRWAIAHKDELGVIQPVVGWKFPWWATAPPAPGGPVPPTRDFFSSEAQKLAKQETASIPADDRLPAIVAGGHVGRTLCAAARPGDLIVVGSRGRGALVETLTGSTGSYCAAHSLVPVVIVPESAHTAEATTHIVVGVDGSANSIAALTWALDHCPAGATIEALHAYVPAAPMFELAETYSDDFEKRAQALLDEAVGVAVAAARQPVATENLVSRIVLEDPRTALTGTDANMIVVGARGHRGVAHLLMGSVATALTHHVETTTVIVPSGG